MKREEVFETINQEREHQLKFEDTASSHIVSTLNMGGILSAIQYNLNQANSTWYKEKEPYTETTAFLRKIGALCVKAGEDYNMTKR